jgi:hypothetical protein
MYIYIYIPYEHQHLPHKRWEDYHRWNYQRKFERLHLRQMKDLNTYIEIFIYISMFLRMYVYMYLYIYTYIYVYVFYIHMYIHIFKYVPEEVEDCITVSTDKKTSGCRGC